MYLMIPVEYSYYNNPLIGSNYDIRRLEPKEIEIKLKKVHQYPQDIFEFDDTLWIRKENILDKKTNNNLYTIRDIEYYLDEIDACLIPSSISQNKEMDKKFKKYIRSISITKEQLFSLYSSNIVSQFMGTVIITAAIIKSILYEPRALKYIIKSRYYDDNIFHIEDKNKGSICRIILEHFNVDVFTTIFTDCSTFMQRFNILEDKAYTEPLAHAARNKSLSNIKLVSKTLNQIPIYNGSKPFITAIHTSIIKKHATILSFILRLDNITEEYFKIPYFNTGVLQLAASTNNWDIVKLIITHKFCTPDLIFGADLSGNTFFDHAHNILDENKVRFILGRNEKYVMENCLESDVLCRAIKYLNSQWLSKIIYNGKININRKVIKYSILYKKIEIFPEYIVKNDMLLRYFIKYIDYENLISLIEHVPEQCLIKYYRLFIKRGILLEGIKIKDIINSKSNNKYLFVDLAINIPDHAIDKLKYLSTDVLINTLPDILVFNTDISIKKLVLEKVSTIKSIDSLQVNGILVTEYVLINQPKIIFNLLPFMNKSLVTSNFIKVIAQAIGKFGCSDGLKLLINNDKFNKSSIRKIVMLSAYNNKKYSLLQYFKNDKIPSKILTDTITSKVNLDTSVINYLKDNRISIKKMQLIASKCCSNIDFHRICNNIVKYDLLSEEIMLVTYKDKKMIQIFQASYPGLIYKFIMSAKINKKWLEGVLGDIIPYMPVTSTLDLLKKAVEVPRELFTISVNINNKDRIERVNLAEYLIQNNNCRQILMYFNNAEDIQFIYNYRFLDGSNVIFREIAKKKTFSFLDYYLSSNINQQQEYPLISRITMPDGSVINYSIFSYILSYISHYDYNKRLEMFMAIIKAHIFNQSLLYHGDDNWEVILFIIKAVYILEEIIKTRKIIDFKPIMRQCITNNNTIVVSLLIKHNLACVEDSMLQADIHKPILISLLNYLGRVISYETFKFHVMHSDSNTVSIILNNCNSQSLNAIFNTIEPSGKTIFTEAHPATLLVLLKSKIFNTDMLTRNTLVSIFDDVIILKLLIHNNMSGIIKSGHINSCAKLSESENKYLIENCLTCKTIEDNGLLYNSDFLFVKYALLKHKKSSVIANSNRESGKNILMLYPDNLEFFSEVIPKVTFKKMLLAIDNKGNSIVNYCLKKGLTDELDIIIKTLTQKQFTELVSRKNFKGKSLIFYVKDPAMFSIKELCLNKQMFNLDCKNESYLVNDMKKNKGIITQHIINGSLYDVTTIVNLSTIGKMNQRLFKLVINKYKVSISNSIDSDLNIMDNQVISKLLICNTDINLSAIINKVFDNIVKYYPLSLKEIVKSRYYTKELISRHDNCLELGYKYQPMSLHVLLETDFVDSILYRENSIGYTILDDFSIQFKKRFTSRTDLLNILANCNLSSIVNEKSIDPKFTCDICYEFDKVVRALPCDHLACVGCSFRMIKCFTCDEIIQSYKPLFV